MVPHDALVSNDHPIPGRFAGSNLAVAPPTPYRADVPIASSLQPRPTSWRRLLIGFLLALVVSAGCGSSDGFDDEPVGPVDGGPRVADARFEGTFEIVDVMVDGVEIALDQRPIIEIEAEFGGLTVMPGCNTSFGSFSLDEDGRASFTVTGGTEIDCGPLADQETAILTALATVDQWSETDDGFRFDGASVSISVAGPVG